jgi:hypothetical protein
MNDLSKRIQARKDCAARYESTFGVKLADRMTELLAKYPDVTAPNWISWEGHRFTNAATSKALRNWLQSLS